MQEPSSGPSYLNSVAYTAAGGVDNLQLGNSLVEQTCYNDLLQPVARRLGDATSTACAVQTSTDLLHLGFGYGSAAANNGNMIQQTVWAPDNGSGSPWTVTQDYTYDAVNRLATSAEKLGGVTQWSRSLSYDHFGNRWVSGATGHTLHMATPTSQSQISAATNRLTGTGITYDNAGNLTAHPYITPGSGSMAYDANNKMKSFTATGVSVATLYDAAGRRVRKFYNGKTTVWVYDAFGKLAAEYTTQQETDEATYFRTTDHLGSTRLTTDDVGAVVARRDYFPFGERIDSTLSGRGSVVDGILASFNASPGMRQQFTGQQRDDETGLDYFWARNYHPALGRFLSIDPASAGARRALPQSWDAFSYTYNNPLRYVDPDGRFAYVSDECGDGDPTECQDACEIDPASQECQDDQGTDLPTDIGGADDDSGDDDTSTDDGGSVKDPGTTPAEACSLAMLISGNCGEGASETLAVIVRLPPHLQAAVLTGIALSRALGVAAERAVGTVLGLAKNSGQILRITNTLSGKTRIPDFYQAATNTIHEVKNASYVSYTSQLRDMANWASTNGGQFVLWVREGASLSSTLQAQVDKGLITIERFTYFP